MRIPFGGSGRLVELKPGTRIDLTTFDVEDVSERPKQLAVLGRGSQGNVTLEVVDGEGCAVKFVRIADDESREALMREIIVAARVCENPCQFVVSPTHVSFVNADGLHCVRLEMELQRGNARELLTAGHQHERQQCKHFVEKVLFFVLFHDVLRGLQYLHEVIGCCHNDIKLENILLDKNGSHFKIGDFGCAVDVATTSSSRIVPDIRPLGVMSMRPPERDVAIVELGGGSRRGTAPVCSAKSDMWSLGVMMSDFFGCFRDETAPSAPSFLQRNRFRRSVKRLLEKLPGDSEHRELAASCLALDINDRPTASEFLLKMPMQETIESMRVQVQGFTTALHVKSGLLKSDSTTTFLGALFDLSKSTSGASLSSEEIENISSPTEMFVPAPVHRSFLKFREFHKNTPR